MIAYDRVFYSFCIKVFMRKIKSINLIKRVFMRKIKSISLIYRAFEVKMVRILYE